jgi:hypothetical protein
MKLLNFLHQVTAMIVAFGLLLVVPMIADFAYDTHVEIGVIIWVNIGIFIMHIKKIDFPVPADEYVDIKGGLKMLWWAIYWPAYLRN